MKAGENRAGETVPVRTAAKQVRQAAPKAVAAAAPVAAAKPAKNAPQAAGRPLAGQRLAGRRLARRRRPSRPGPAPERRHREGERRRRPSRGCRSPRSTPTRCGCPGRGKDTLLRLPESGAGGCARPSCGLAGESLPGRRRRLGLVTRHPLVVGHPVDDLPRLLLADRRRPRAAAASWYQRLRQFRQKPARFIRSMFCTSVRARR